MWAELAHEVSEHVAVVGCDIGCRSDSVIDAAVAAMASRGVPLVDSLVATLLQLVLLMERSFEGEEDAAAASGSAKHRSRMHVRLLRSSDSPGHTGAAPRRAVPEAEMDAVIGALLAHPEQRQAAWFVASPPHVAHFLGLSAARMNRERWLVLNRVCEAGPVGIPRATLHTQLRKHKMTPLVAFGVLQFLKVSVVEETVALDRRRASISSMLFLRKHLSSDSWLRAKNSDDAGVIPLVRCLGWMHDYVGSQPSQRVLYSDFVASFSATFLLVATPQHVAADAAGAVLDRQSRKQLFGFVSNTESSGLLVRAYRARGRKSSFRVVMLAAAAASGTATTDGAPAGAPCGPDDCTQDTESDHGSSCARTEALKEEDDWPEEQEEEEEEEEGAKSEHVAVCTAATSTALPAAAYVRPQWPLLQQALWRLLRTPDGRTGLVLSQLAPPLLCGRKRRERFSILLQGMRCASGGPAVISIRKNVGGTRQLVSLFFDASRADTAEIGTRGDGVLKESFAAVQRVLESCMPAITTVQRLVSATGLVRKTVARVLASMHRDGLVAGDAVVAAASAAEPVDKATGESKPQRPAVSWKLLWWAARGPFTEAQKLAVVDALTAELHEKRRAAGAASGRGSRLCQRRQQSSPQRKSNGATRRPRRRRPRTPAASSSSSSSSTNSSEDGRSSSDSDSSSPSSSVPASALHPRRHGVNHSSDEQESWKNLKPPSIVSQTTSNRRPDKAVQMIDSDEAHDLLQRSRKNKGGGSTPSAAVEPRVRTAADQLLAVRNGFAIDGIQRCHRLHLELWAISMELHTHEHHDVDGLFLLLSLGTACVSLGVSVPLPPLATWETPLGQLPPRSVDLAHLHRKFVAGLADLSQYGVAALSTSRRRVSLEPLARLGTAEFAFNAGSPLLLARISSFWNAIAVSTVGPEGWRMLEQHRFSTRQQEALLRIFGVCPEPTASQLVGIKTAMRGKALRLCDVAWFFFRARGRFPCPVSGIGGEEGRGGGPSGSNAAAARIAAREKRMTPREAAMHHLRRQRQLLSRNPPRQSFTDVHRQLSRIAAGALPPARRPRAVARLRIACHHSIALLPLVEAVEALGVTPQVVDGIFSPNLAAPADHPAPSGSDASTACAAWKSEGAEEGEVQPSSLTTPAAAAAAVDGSASDALLREIVRAIVRADEDAYCAATEHRLLAAYDSHQLSCVVHGMVRGGELRWRRVPSRKGGQVVVAAPLRELLDLEPATALRPSAYDLSCFTVPNGGTEGGAPHLVDEALGPADGAHTALMVAVAALGRCGSDPEVLTAPVTALVPQREDQVVWPLLTGGRTAAGGPSADERDDTAVFPIGLCHIRGARGAVKRQRGTTLDELYAAAVVAPTGAAVCGEVNQGEAAARPQSRLPPRLCALLGNYTGGRGVLWLRQSPGAAALPEGVHLVRDVRGVLAPGAVDDGAALGPPISPDPPEEGDGGGDHAVPAVLVPSRAGMLLVVGSACVEPLLLLQRDRDEQCPTRCAEDSDNRVASAAAASPVLRAVFPTSGSTIAARHDAILRMPSDSSVLARSGGGGSSSVTLAPFRHLNGAFARQLWVLATATLFDAILFAPGILHADLECLDADAHHLLGGAESVTACLAHLERGGWIAARHCVAPPAGSPFAQPPTQRTQRCYFPVLDSLTRGWPPHPCAVHLA